MLIQDVKVLKANTLLGTGYVRDYIKEPNIEVTMIKFTTLRILAKVLTRDEIEYLKANSSLEFEEEEIYQHMITPN